MRTSLAIGCVLVAAWLLLRGGEEPPGPDPLTATEEGPDASDAALLHTDAPPLDRAAGGTPPGMDTPPADPEPGLEETLPEEPLEAVFEYRDRGQPRRVWLNPRRMAEFGASLPAGVTPQPPVPGALLLRMNRGVYLWLLDGTESSVAVAARLRAGGDGIFSAVVHDAPSTKGKMRALRGGLLLAFRPDWEAERVEAWVREHSLEGLRKLTLGPGWYGVTTEPGVDGLRLARELMATGDLLEASPNWWRDQRPR